MKKNRECAYIVELDKNGVAVLEIYEIKEKLDNFSDICEEGVILRISERIYDLEKINKYTISSLKERELIGFKIEKNGEYGKIVLTSPYMKAKLIKGCPLTIAIGQNKAGERINCIIRKKHGELISCKYDKLVSTMNNLGGRLANMFMRDGALTLTKGSEKMPIMELGQKLEARVEVGKAIEKGKKNENPPKNIIELMRKQGMPVDKYKLNNDKYPHTTLVFFYDLFLDGKENIVANMLTTQKFKQEQLEQIALGIENGVNIKKYADPDISAKRMKEIREGLEKGYWKKGMTIPLNKTLDKMMKKRNKTQDKELDKKIIKAKNLIAKSEKE